MKNIFKKQIFVKAAFIPHLKKWVFPQPNHKNCLPLFIIYDLKTIYCIYFVIMITRTFLSKSNTIVENSTLNFGLNPIVMLHYGKSVSRGLLYFNIDKIKENFDDKNYNKDNTKHYLKMYNCASLKDITNDDGVHGKRATSFTIIAFPIPKKWDAGVGFNKESDFWAVGDAKISKDASSWYYSMTGNPWEDESNPNLSEGIYSNDFLSKEYDNFLKGKDSLIISSQHFDYGNENLKLDITKYVNSIIFDNCPNKGICIAFAPDIESLDSENSEYVGFFGPHTNTFFAPIIESINDYAIEDDRYDFHLNTNNKLYFYSNVNLDVMPKCIINDKEYEVIQEYKGVYSCSVNLSLKEHEIGELLYDVWTNLFYDGEELDDVEMSFETLAPKLKLGSFDFSNKNLSPKLNGINDMEKLSQGEERLLKVTFMVPFSKNEYEFPEKSYYRLYVKDGNREVDVIEWQKIDKISDFNAFKIKTDELIPNEYHIDLKTVYGANKYIYKNVLMFNVINNVSDIKK